MLQRICDILLSGIALVFFFPIMLLIALLLRFTGEREIFYVQNRIGLGGKQFGLVKFATMLKNSPNIGAGVITLKDDPRVLPLGRFLRKSKLNELPQLWNTFIGEMSLVGPRPMVPSTYTKYPATAQAKLTIVRPGLSGVGSIVFRDEERYLRSPANSKSLYEAVIIPYKSSLEVWYVNNNSFWMYIKVILVTLLVVFRPTANVEKWFLGIPIKPKELNYAQVSVE